MGKNLKSLLFVVKGESNLLVLRKKLWRTANWDIIHWDIAHLVPFWKSLKACTIKQNRWDLRQNAM